MFFGLFLFKRTSISSSILSNLKASDSCTYGSASKVFFSSSSQPRSDTIRDNDLHGFADPATVRLSKLLSQHSTNLSISRRQAESMIKEGLVTFAGDTVWKPNLLLNWKDLKNSAVVKVQGKAVTFDIDFADFKHQTPPPKVWAVHKLAGEMVSESDPQNRPSMIQRLVRGGVGRDRKQRYHLKPIGRLDMPTEGLILVTSDGNFSRQMELPSNHIHRVYRARVHGSLSTYKLDRIRKGGIHYQGVSYGPMKVAVERSYKKSTNTWVQVTTVEGKNRQIRNVFKALGVSVTRLIRIAYGDYKLQTIPPGLAIEVPYKPVESQKARGLLYPKKKMNKLKEPIASPVQWVRPLEA